MAGEMEGEVLLEFVQCAVIARLARFSQVVEGRVGAIHVSGVMLAVMQLQDFRG